MLVSNEKKGPKISQQKSAKTFLGTLILCDQEAFLYNVHFSKGGFKFLSLTVNGQKSNAISVTS